MKKLLALLLSLMLLLPAAGLGEAASNPDVYTVDFDDFTITLSAEDAMQKGQKVDGSLLFILYPAYDETATFHPNINSLWTSQDMTEIEQHGAEAFGNEVMAQSASELAKGGIAVSNQQLLAAELDAETKATTLMFAMDVDYSSIGINLAMTLYQLQMYIPMGDGAGSYIFTLSADSPETVNTLLAYLNNIQFKE